MVDKKQILSTFINHFIAGSGTSIDITDSGLVNADGGVRMIRRSTTLPVTFGEISGDFIIEDKGLVSLEGCPKMIGGSFVVTQNLLSTLVGLPEDIGVSSELSWMPFTPLLRLSNVSSLGYLIRIIIHSIEHNKLS
jgi:hypothetical protein